MKLITTPQHLIVDLEGAEVLWGMKSKVIVLKNSISDLEWCPEFSDWRKYEFRMPGTYVPGAIIAGSFWTNAGWDFIYVRQPHGMWRPRLPDVLVIETKNERYKRIIVNCSSKEAERLRAWLKKR